MNTRIMMGVLAAAVVIAGCGGGDAPTSKPAASAAGSSEPAASAAKPAGDPGAVVGTVKYGGPPPRVFNLKMSADPYCDDANKGGAKRSAAVVGDGGGLADVLVYVSSAVPGSYPAPSTASVLDQTACNYAPRVIGVQVDQPIEIRNSDATLHNVHSLPENSKGFNLAMPTKGMKQTRKFGSAEVFVRIKCDVHPWMETHVGVLENPFFQVTDETGAFSISGIPAGDYTLTAAHPRMGTKSASLKVEPGGKATVDFMLAPPS